MAAKVGRFLFILGLIITVIGLIAGFTLMFKDYDELAKVFLMIIPIGFIIGFAGLTATLITSPDSKRERFNDSL
ncbi:hypothetical protein [Leucothrix arctica]|uniref:DUF3098 domain-containing protein n=1 Tax=Leucothrix arctica TaxID=1481894 RepID=A0A317CK49_9GAMM|nr:hypothetical protein [Leucothrix arctica]PWQ98975.1 hypothetical protein DKT75_02110 [Leucothrix arctica]